MNFIERLAAKRPNLAGLLLALRSRSIASIRYQSIRCAIFKLSMKVTYQNFLKVYESLFYKTSLTQKMFNALYIFWIGILNLTRRRVRAKEALVLNTTALRNFVFGTRLWKFLNTIERDRSQFLPFLDVRGSLSLRRAGGRGKCARGRGGNIEGEKSCHVRKSR